MKLNIKLWHVVCAQILFLASLVWAADSRITDLTELTAPATGDWLEIVDVSDTTDNAAGSSRKVTVSNLAMAIGAGQLYTLGSDYTNSTTTGTEITGIGPMTVPTATATYGLDCNLVIQSAATATSIKFGVNYTGTGTLLTANDYYPSTGTTATTGIADDVTAVAGGTIYEANAATSFSTTSPNLGPNTGVATANTNIFYKLSAILTSTVAGDIEVWAGSEVASSQITVKAGSHCVVRRLA